MKKMMSIIAALALGATVVLAAPNGGWSHGKQNRGQSAEKLSAKLNLSDAQKAQLQQLRQSFREQNKDFFASSRQTRQEYRAALQAGDTAKADSLKPTLDAQKEQMKQLREQEHAQMLSILTPEQRTKLETMQSSARERGWKGQRRGAFREQQMGRLAEKLNLTDAQKEQMKILREDFREQNKDFFESMRQTRQQLRQARAAGDTARADSLQATIDAQKEQMKQLREQEHARMLSILTPEQKTQLESMKAKRGSRGHDGHR